MSAASDLLYVTHCNIAKCGVPSPSNHLIKVEGICDFSPEDAEVVLAKICQRERLLGFLDVGFILQKQDTSLRS
jgi:hypothetical protein